MNELAIQENTNIQENPLKKFTQGQIDAIKGTVAKDATDDELYMFLSIASKYGLDPFLKEVWLTKIKGETNIMVGRDGYVKIARQTPGFQKLVSDAVFENDEFSIQWEGMNQTITHKHAAKDRGKILGAWAGLKMQGKEDYFLYVPYHEYAKNNNIWTKSKSAMIRKVAEKEVCRVCCGITGINTEEEMPEEYSLEHSQAHDDESVVDVEFTTPSKEAEKVYHDPEELLKHCNYEDNHMMSKTNFVIFQIHSSNAADDVKVEAMEMAIERNSMTTLDGAAKIPTEHIYMAVIERLKLENKEINNENVLETLNEYYKSKILSRDRCMDVHKYIQDKTYARKACLNMMNHLEERGRPVHRGSIRGEYEKIKDTLTEHQQEVLDAYIYRLNGEHGTKCKEQIENECWIYSL